MLSCRLGAAIGRWPRPAPATARRRYMAGAAILFTLAGTATGARGADSGGPEEITVTGSRIKNSDAAAANPISVLSTADIEATKASSIEDLFQHTIGVDFNGGSQATNNNGGGGTSNIGMRNLGPQRTLILIDGQRLIPYNGGSPDLNAIPMAMVERIEVLRDGASSIYGADAIGGVVNIITKKNADGMTFDSYAGTSGHGDGTSYSATGTLAHNFERGNLMISVGHEQTDAIPQANRSWATATHADDPNFPVSSSYRNQIADALQDENSNTVWLNGQTLDVTKDCQKIVAQTVGNVCINGVAKLNASYWQTLTSSITRNQINSSAHYDLTDDIVLKLSGFYTERQSEQLLRPEPILGDMFATPTFPGLFIPPGYAGNTTGQTVVGMWTPSAFGPRDYKQSSDTYRINVGLAGDLFGKYDWEAGYVFQANHTIQETLNEGNMLNLAQYIGQLPCFNTPGGCSNGQPTVPLNLFNLPSSLTPQLRNYLTFDNLDILHEHERYAYGTISGPLADLPAGPLKIALGGEIRHEDFSNVPDGLVIEGFGDGQQFPTFGAYNVASTYAELNAPILTDLPAVQSLTADLSTRFDHYSDFGNAVTYKSGLDWAVTPDLRLRGGYSKGFRAPQIGELYGGQSINTGNASGDPCETNKAYGPSNGNFGVGLLGAGTTCSLAVAGGKAVTNFTDPLDRTANSAQNVLGGGSTDLKPETSHQFTLGAVATPRFLPGFSAAADYYNVRIENAILIGGIAGSVGVDPILDGCYGPAQNKAYCALIQRSPSGTITLVNSLNSNFGYEKAQGIDFDFSYENELRALGVPIEGRLHLNLQTSLQFELEQENPDYSVTSFPGTYSPGLTNGFIPRWRGILNTDYADDNWGLHWDTRFIDHMRNLSGGPDVTGNRTPDMFYQDISAHYLFKDVPYVKSVRATIGIDNLLDQDPPWLNGPSADSNCKCGTIAGGFDEVGRYFYLRLSTSL